MKDFKAKGMYALLVVVAAVIGITIYASCSADDDYDNYSSGNELFTLADGEMSLRSDVGGSNRLYASVIIPNIIFRFTPHDNPDDSSLFVYDTCQVTCRFSCGYNYSNLTIEDIELPLNNIEVLNKEIQTWYPYVQQIYFTVFARIKREINNTTYYANGTLGGSIPKTAFHYN